MRIWLQSKGAEGEPTALAGTSLSVTDVWCGDGLACAGAIGASDRAAFSFSVTTAALRAAGHDSAGHDGAQGTTAAEGPTRAAKPEWGEGGRRLQRREARAEKAMLASRNPPFTTVNATISQSASAGAKASTRPATKITAP